MQSKSLENIALAAEMFEKGNLPSRAIQCYERIGAWEQLLHCLHRHSDAFLPSQRQVMANRYIPIALNKLYQIMTQEVHGGKA